MLKKKVTSLDKNYSAEIFLKRPDKYREIEKISSNLENIITMGSFYSYTAASFQNNNLSIDLTKFDRIIEFDKENKLITVEAGISFSKLFNFTLKQNLWIPQTPGYPGITLGGAVATNSHGKSCGYHGTIRKQINKILLFHKNHGWLNLSENENKDIFDITIGGLGLTGTIVHIQLKLENFVGENFTTKIKETISSKDTIKNMKLKQDKEIYYYSWNRTDSLNNFGKGFIFQNEVNLKQQTIKSKKISTNLSNIHRTFGFNFWNKFTINLSQSAYYNYYKYFKKNEFEDNFQNVIFPFVGKEFYFNLFGNKGFLESQVIVPLEKMEIFIDEVQAIYKKIFPNITLYSIKNFKGECSYLRFENDGICFTFDFIKNKKNISFMEKIDEICEKYLLIPSIIKDSRLKLSTIEKCYKDYHIFKDKIYKFDNKRIYRSALSDRLNI